MNLLQMPVGDMSINLRCPDALMAQHFLDGTDVSTAYQKVCGKRMPQGVRGGLDGQASSFCILGNYILDGPGR